ncbi:MFS transporter [Propionivibrio dicarboxylicus]|uniref:Sugar phosphate permease n=1 Tax=Propionivibrio dicarboxylicus TaxID=83767 RepID=A0A1G8HZ51_9RHOO|nr:MFS transporter [Propionivibrio dicarboxylicus]SDI11959.1 Sugar phosphate permease [Propionivibrio dicarboxylicus]
MSSKRGLHYSWVIVATGVFVLFATIALGRFSYTAILPGMKAGLALGYDQMGLIGTANFVGYLIAVWAFPSVIHRLEARCTIALGLLLVGGSLVGMSFCGGFPSAVVVYVPAGMGTAFGQIGMMTVIQRWYRSEQRGKASGLVTCGNGLGIVFVGAVIPWFNQVNGSDGWRHAWLVFGLVALAVMLLAAAFLRSSPADVGLEPIGKAGDGAPLAAQVQGFDKDLLLRFGAVYLIFGATHMIYGTFIVSSMVSDHGLSVQTAGFYWSSVGILSLVSGIGFGALSDVIGRRYGLAVIFVVHSLAYFLAGIEAGSVALIGSIVLFGISMFAVPAVMAAAIGDYFGVVGAARAFSLISLFYGAGQTLGPAIAGVIAGSRGSFSSTYLLSSMLTLVAAVYSAKLPPPPVSGRGVAARR